MSVLQPQRPSRYPRAMGCLFWSLRCFALPMMAGSLGLYIAMHSPFRRWIAALLGLESRSCFFVCGDALNASPIANSIASLVLLTAALLAAWVVATKFDGEPYERPLTFSLIALAFIVVPAAAIGGIASWSDTAFLRSPWGPMLCTIPAAVLVAVAAWQGWRPPWPRLSLGSTDGLVFLVGALALCLLFASSAISLMHPPTGYDALGFHAPLAVFLWRDGNLDTFLDRAPGGWTLAHPGTVHLWFGLLQVAGGERVANLGQLPFAFLGSAAVGAYTQRLGLDRNAALLAAGAFLLMPVVVMQSGMQLADVAGAGLLMAALALACAPISNWTSSRLALVGLGLGLAVTTRVALLPGIAGIGLFLIGATLWGSGQRADVHSKTILLGIAALAFLAVVAPWWVRNVVRYENPIYPAVLPFLGRGISQLHFPMKDLGFVPSPVAWPLYPLIEGHSEYSGFGALFVVGVIPGFVRAVLRCHRQPIILYLIMVAFMLPAWWLFTRHEPRFLVAIFGLGLAFLPWSLQALPRRQRRMGSVLVAAAAIFSALVTVEQALLPAARQPNTRWEFYDHVWGVDPVVSSLPEHEGILLNTGYAKYTYPGYYPLLGRSLTRLVIPVDKDVSTEAIAARMRQAGVRYAYVTASSQWRPIVEATYDGSRFELMHISVVEKGMLTGTRRYLYRLK
jgi:hypothetical protein